MENTARYVADPSLNRGEVASSPHEIVLRPPGIHPRTRGIIKHPQGRAQDSAITAPYNARIVQTVCFECFPGTRPGQSSCCQPPLPGMAHQQVFGSRFTGCHLVHHRPCSCRSVQGAYLVERHIGWKIHALVKEVHQGECIERMARPLRPVVAGEDDVAVQPGDLVTGVGDLLQRDVEQTLLLPHNVAPVKLHEHVGIALAELKGPVEGSWQTLVGWATMLAILWITVTMPGLIYQFLTDPSFRETVNPISSMLIYLVTLGALFTIGALASWCLNRREQLAKDLRHRVLSKSKPDGLVWVDHYSSRDPVPAGPLLPPDTSGGPDSARVHNRHSIWTDHTSYWRSMDGLVTDLSIRLADLAGIDLPYRDGLSDGALRRRWRVQWLGVLRMLVLGSAVYAVWTLHRLDLLQPIANSVGNLVSPAESDQGITGLAASLAKTRAAAGALIFGSVALWYFVVSRIWHAWDQYEVARFFDRKPMQLGGPWVLALLAVSLVPASVATVLWWSGGLSQLAAAIPALPEISRPLAQATSISMLMGLFGGAMSGLIAGFHDWHRSDKWYRHPFSIAVAGALFIFGLFMALLGLVVKLQPALLSGQGTGHWGLDLGVGIGVSVLLFGIFGGYGWALYRLFEKFQPARSRTRHRASTIAEKLLDLPDEPQSELTLGIVSVLLGALTIGLSAAIYKQWHPITAGVLLVPVVAFAVMAGWRARNAEKNTLPNRLGVVSIYLIIGALGVREFLNWFLD